MKKSISVLIPAYNEEELIKGTTLKLYSYLQSLKKTSIISSFEIIICINASTDKTEKIASKLSKNYKEVRYFSIKEKGMGIALTEGMKRAKNNIITFIAADYETLPDFIERAIPLMDKYQLINCSRYLNKQPRGSGFFRIFLSYMFREFFRLMFKYKFSEAGSGKVFRKDASRILLPHLKGEGGNWQMDVLYYSLKYKLKLKEIPLYIRINRKASESRSNLFKETFGLLKSGLKYSIRIYLGV